MAILRALLVVFTAVLVVGCSGQPGEREIKSLLEAEIKTKLDNHHANRNAFGSMVRGFGGAPASSNPTSSSFSIERLSIVEEGTTLTMFGDEIPRYVVDIDVKYSGGGSPMVEKDKRGVITLGPTGDGWAIFSLSFTNFIGFRQFH